MMSKEEREKMKIEASKKEVKMTFKEDKFYNDLSKAHFEAGKVYVVKGQDMIDRWLKRGGIIVDELGKGEKLATPPDESQTQVDQAPVVEAEPVAESKEKSEDDHKDSKHKGHGKGHAHGHKHK